MKSRNHHPVVHVAHEDAVAYATWAGKQLPSEAEWERAARGGVEGVEFAWGEELHPGGRPMANTFQGDFPHHNSLLDGYGLLDMIGNVWEWTDDWYQHHGADAEVQRHQDQTETGCCPIPNPRGGSREANIDPTSQHQSMPRKVVKGGSFLCTPSY
ncbi:formylglycine-generating enzyme family protein [Synechococcus sp. CS-1328]|uniref:formylglycine-generating enzyme family protein n=1 Tax=Synechococcus sp. CS-1328 TaxID=2847976 RepID=UPI00223A7461|nr:formylglycine-generating enzyme family protein [Synechococcus sp. CS-1328]